MPKSLDQLLGGYATNTLTEEENQLLMEAALHDQSLFDALADEEALKALLADPNTRQRILTSLEESQKSLCVARSRSSWFSWFRQPSSLAWAGSVAAMGLALIFGWQMENDWGSIVQQEEQVERSISEDRDRKRNEIAISSKESEATQTKEPSQVSQKSNQRLPERVAGLPAQVPSIQPSSIATAAKDPERFRQSLAQVSSDGFTREAVEKERRPKTQEFAPRAPESAIVQHASEIEGRDAPALAVPDITEKTLQPVARPPSFADKLEVDNTLSSPSSREVIEGQKSKQVEAGGKAVEGRRAQQLLRGAISQAKKADGGAVLDLKETVEVVQEDSQGLTRGIRYRFVQPVIDGEDTSIDPTDFSGKWSELQLRIDSNVSGHLYVMTAYGSGRWQWMKPVPSNIRRSSDGAIQVKPYQAVNFGLSQVTNRLGKPVVSFITVLLASTPLDDLGEWLGRGVGSGQSEDSLTQERSPENFIFDSSLEPGKPLRVNIDLKGETRSIEVLDPMPANEFSP